MLIEFRTENYKTFASEVCFSMKKKSEETNLDYSIKKIRDNHREELGVLCSSVIYGANAAGKTNIIGAVEVLRSLVLRGNINNNEGHIPPNRAVSILELIPNNQLDEIKPVSFFIDFQQNEYRVQYELVVDLGGFLDATHHRKVLKEKLDVNGNMVFIREEDIQFGDLTMVNIAKSKATYSDIVEQIALAGLSDDELFLSNGFKMIIAPDFFKQVIRYWFDKILLVIYDSDDMEVQVTRLDAEEGHSTMFMDKRVDSAIRMFSFDKEKVRYISTNGDNEARLCSVFEKKDEDKYIAIPARAYESLGTIRIINLLPVFFKALETGGVLIIDELDASLHPMALMNLINIFHNDDINIHHAQLIFNTHNPILLNPNLFRKDEIKFIDRDEDSGESELYSLADFDDEDRSANDYMMNYFINRYGAIKDIDFSSVFVDTSPKEEDDQ